MMKRILKGTKHIVIIAAAMFGTVACLEKYPGSAIPQDEAMKTFNDAQQHLTGVYSSLNSSALYSGLLTLLPDIQADLVNAVEGNSNTYGNIYQWKVLANDPSVEAVYASLYSVIGNCNFFLDNVANVRESVTVDQQLDLLDEYTGQVYAVRALCYSELIKFFCKAYDPETAKSEKGVVLRTKYYEPEPTVRASLFDSYGLVIKDLERAEKLLDGKQDKSDNMFLTLGAVQAIHARVALYMQDWDAAIKYSTILIEGREGQSNAYALSSGMIQGGVYGQAAYSQFDGLWYFDKGSEIIWKIGFTPTSAGGALGSVFLNYTRDMVYFYPDYVPSQWVLDLYTEKDSRYMAYFADSEITGIEMGYAHKLAWPVLVKYFGNREFTNNYLLFHVNMPKPLRLAEQYLIRAEAYCRSTTQQNYGKASQDLNALRSARIAQGGKVSLGADNWLKEISNERVRELYMEGFRLQDLKRWKQGFELKNPKVAGIQKEGSDLKVSVDNPLFVWPIPKHELESPGSQITPNDSNR